MKKIVFLIVVLASVLAASVGSAQTVLRPSSTSMWAINDTTNVGMADSSAVYQFSNYSALGVFIKCDDASPVRLAVQVRVHPMPAGSALLPDSNNVAVWFPSENSSIVSTGATDSLSYGYFRLGDSVTQHNGEILVRTLVPGAAATKWSAGSGIYLYLPVRAPYISVRVRVLNAPISAPRVKVMLTGLRS